METIKLTEEQIEQLANEIRDFLIEYKLWIDVCIYYNGKCMTAYDRETGKYYYNDPEHVVCRENEKPETYFEYVNPEHILSMSFEGDPLEMIYYNSWPGTKKQFDHIFEKYGVYYEMGNIWNLTCYYMGE